MFPHLFSIGPVTLDTLPLFWGIAFFGGLFAIWKRGRELHFDEKELFDSFFVILFWTLLGARLGYIGMYAVQHGIMPGMVWNVLLRPGFYLPLGFIFAALAAFRVSKKQRWDAYQLLDILVTGLAAAQAIIALGSFAAGVGYGIPTKSVIGVHFSGLYDKRYPIQLWEMMGFGICFAYLWWVEGVYRTFPWYRGKKSQAATGFLTSLYLIWWGFITLVATLFRTPLLIIYGIRVDYIIPLLVGVVGGSILLMYRASGSWQSMYVNWLEYFGLSKRPLKRKTHTDVSKLFE